MTELVTPRNETRQKLLCAIDSFILQASDKLGDGSRLQLLEVSLYVCDVKGCVM